MKKLIVAILATSLLSACGWHLRGSLLLPDNLKSLYISAKDSHGNLATEIKKVVQAYDVELAESSNSAQYSLFILEEREKRRTVSVGNDALATEYEITMTADYSIQGEAGAVLVPKATATVIRSYDHDRDNVLSTNEEERLIREEMRLDLIQQIVRRLRYASTTQTTGSEEAAPAEETSEETSPETDSNANG